MADPKPTTKRCAKCGGKGPFHKDRTMKDGLRADCAACAREYYAAWYARNRERVRNSVAAWQRAHPERLLEYAARARGKYPTRHRARKAAGNAIRDGRLKRGPCEVCGLRPLKIGGRQRIEAHHHKGYAEEHWLDVQWLCGPHHAEADTEQAAEAIVAAAGKKP